MGIVLHYFAQLYFTPTHALPPQRNEIIKTFSLDVIFRYSIFILIMNQQCVQFQFMMLSYPRPPFYEMEKISIKKIKRLKCKEHVRKISISLKGLNKAF